MPSRGKWTLFLDYLPDSMERIYAKIPEEKLTAYHQRAVAETVALAQEFFVAT